MGPFGPMMMSYPGAGQTNEMASQGNEQAQLYSYPSGPYTYLSWPPYGVQSGVGVSADWNMLSYYTSDILSAAQNGTSLDLSTMVGPTPTLDGLILSALTPGQIIFPNSSKQLAGSSSLFWDDTNKEILFGNSAAHSGLSSTVTARNSITIPVGAQADCLLIQPTFITAASGNHTIIAGSFFDIPIMTYNGATVGELNTVYIAGQPVAGGGNTTQKSFHVGAGNSVIRDKLGVGSAIVNPTTILHVAGFQASNQLTLERAGNNTGSVCLGGDSDGFTIQDPANAYAKRFYVATAGLVSIGVPTNSNYPFYASYGALTSHRWRLENSKANATANDGGLEIWINNSTPALKNYGYAVWQSSAVTAGSEVTTFNLGGYAAGVLDNRLTMVGQLFGINNNSPNRLLDILDSANAQLRLSQANTTVFAELQCKSDGNLYFTSTNALQILQNLQTVVSAGIGIAVNSSYRQTEADTQVNSRDRFENNHANGVSNDMGFEFYLQNASATKKLYGYLIVGSSTVTAGAEQSTWSLGVMDAGSNFTALTVIGQAFKWSSGSSLGFFGVSAVGQQARGATLTNNVTVGGVNDTIANFTDLVTYANDAAAIRNDIYQLARIVRMHDVALRALGLET